MPGPNQSLTRVLIFVVPVLFAMWIFLSVSEAARPATRTSIANPTSTLYDTWPTPAHYITTKIAKNTETAALAAWDQLYSVLISPRCINCHTATNYPQQGDDRHRHFANVIRGPEGKGVPALNCVSCHQEQNADSTGVPGGPNWHLAPLSMQWQDSKDRPLSSAAVCRSVTDRSKNENMDAT
ncbi:MAG: hypothetical protein ABR555_17065, partial [Pyrinomonadaceae bacterium]